MSGAPLVDGDRLICLVGGEPDAKFMALDKFTGEEIWRALSSDWEPGYTAPIIIEAGRRSQLIAWHPRAISSLDPATGELHWEVPHIVDMGINPATPVQSGPYLFVTSQYGGTRMIRLDETGPQGTLLWEGAGEADPDHGTVVNTFNSVISTPVIDGNYLYGLDGHGLLRCLHLTTGERVWESWALQSTESDCRQSDLGLGCSETEALARVERVLAAHRQEITTLATFGRAGSNRVVVVPGDHDAALLLPAVARRVEEALGGSVSRVEVAIQGYWASADGQLYAEHGHQLRQRATRLSAWPRPFVDRDGQTFLERSWGEQTVAAFFDERETSYPIIDNLANEAGLVYGLAADGISDAGDRAPLLLRYVLFRMPWSQFRVDLDAGDVRPPAWDLSAVRAVGPAFLTESLPDDHLFKPLATTALDGGQLADMMAAMTDEELTAVCDYRAATRRSRRRFERILTQFDPQGPPGAECPRLPGTRGGAFDYFWRTRDRIFARQLEEAQARLSSTARSIAVFVHGHTHLVDWKQRVLELTSQGRTVIVDGFSPVRNALRPVVVNGGAWQRTITPVQLERLKQTECVGRCAPCLAPTRAALPLLQLRLDRAV